MSPKTTQSFSRTRGFFLLQDGYAAIWMELDANDTLVRLAEPAASLLRINYLPGRRLPAHEWASQLEPSTADRIRELARACRKAGDRAHLNGLVVTLPGNVNGRFAVSAECLQDHAGAVKLTLTPTEAPPASGVLPVGKAHNRQVKASTPPSEKVVDNDTETPAEKLPLEARAIVHDFKNLLVGIVGNLSLAQRQLDPDSPVQARLKAAESASQRARELVLQLLSTEEATALVKHPVRLADLVEECVAETLGGTSCACAVTLPEDLWVVPVDEGRFCQALSNLLINAMQAMDNKGAVTVTAENSCFAAGNPHQLAEGAYVSLSVCDQGPGVPEDLWARIFEPLFTTKACGNGLGLANVKKILESHGGTIVLGQNQPSGAKFTCFLPALPDVALQTVPPSDARQVQRGLNILLVDDNPIVRETTGELLDALGHKPCFAAGPEDAIAQLKSNRGKGTPIKMVLLDLNLSHGVHGRDLVPKLREHEPELVIIISSGAPTDPYLLNPSKIACDGSLVKPFNIDQLKRCIEGAAALAVTRPPWAQLSAEADSAR
ncbi:MAG: ATP-binding protein [Opitutales bacterium]